MAGQIDNLINVCSFHTEEELDHYCKTCARALCEECIKLDHRDHDWCKLKKVAQDIRRSTSDKITEIINQEIPKIESNLKAIAEVEEKNKAAKTEKINRIKHRENELVSAVKVISDNLIKELSEVSSSEAGEHGRSSEDNNITTLHNLTGYFTENKDRADDVAIVKLHEKIRNRLSAIKLHDPQRAEDHVEFNEGQIDIHFLEHMFGRVVRDNYLHSRLSGVEIEGTTLTELFNFQVTSNPILSLSEKSLEETWIYGRNDKEIKLCNTDGGVLRKFDLDIVVIRGFVRLDNGDLIIADSGNRVLSRWSIKDGEIKIITNLSPFEPLGVALSLKKELLVGTKDRFNTRRIVQKMAINGRVLHSYEYEEGHREWIKYYLFNSPDRVAENFNRDLCVVDTMSRNTGRLLIITEAGKLRVIYTDLKLTKSW
ncbi:uncharacterized protein LOC133191404 [Saccostrea echinata]|uniref:uncharacterized protein LOC133191404 n=1 Tax=Saccostrea echinata TaxID=191078 RepID=UPI002A7FACDF|nr:uncharacterized protein LOC133191404 [Saccostrea echinata]